MRLPLLFVIRACNRFQESCEICRSGVVSNPPDLWFTYFISETPLDVSAPHNLQQQDVQLPAGQVSDLALGDRLHGSVMIIPVLIGVHLQTVLANSAVPADYVTSNFFPSYIE